MLRKLAIIGCGAVTEKGHLPAARQVAGCEVVLLVDRDLSRAKALADRHGISGVSQDYRDAIGRADAAIVALPHHLHAPVCGDLLVGGLHVLVEKPMALSKAECESMIRAAEKTGKILCVGLMRRFLNSARFVREALHHGRLGKVLDFDVREGGVYNWPVQSDFFFRRETAGGGVLLDTGAHTLDLVLWWLGEAGAVEYRDDAYGGVEADGRLDLTMKSGAKGVVELSRTRNLRNTAIIQCERGTLEVHLRQNHIRLSDLTPGLDLDGLCVETGSSSPGPQAFADLFAPQLAHWLGAIEGRHAPSVSGEEAIRSIALIEQCYRQRKPLDLPWMKF